MSMNAVPSIVTAELLLVYSSGLIVPYQSPPLPADVLGMPWGLFMFVHNQVYLGRFSITLCVHGGKQCPTSGHNSSAGHISMGHGDT